MAQTKAENEKDVKDLASRPAKTAGQIVSIEALIQAGEAFGIIHLTAEQHQAALLVGTPIMTFLWNLAEIVWAKVARALSG